MAPDWVKDSWAQEARGGGQSPGDSRARATGRLVTHQWGQVSLGRFVIFPRKHRMNL